MTALYNSNSVLLDIMVRCVNVVNAERLEGLTILYVMFLFYFMDTIKVGQVVSRTGLTAEKPLYFSVLCEFPNWIPT